MWGLSHTQGKQHLTLLRDITEARDIKAGCWRKETLSSCRTETERLNTLQGTVGFENLFLLLFFFFSNVIR